MGGCTSSPAKEDARPKQSAMPIASSAKPVAKTPQTPMSQPAASVNANNHAQMAHTPGPPVAASPVLKATGESTPNGDGGDDLAAFLNEGPVSPTQSDVMAGAQSKGPKDRSYAIDKQIEEDSRKFKKECKILLLGSGESGKSTIVKQMKIIHQNGYSKDELLQFKMVIYKNLIDSAQALILACRKIGVDPEDPTNRVRDFRYYQVNADAILEYRIDADPNHTLSQDIALAIESLWHDPIIPSVMDSFFQHVRRIAAPDFVPMEADVLRARTKTTGISETRFNMGQLSIHMFDVGGQRSERKKWIHCFEAVTSIIFCVALSEYDQVLLEESGQNRMQESLILFESVINSRWFLRSSVILFLNKIDVFKMKLSKTPLDRYFPEYTGKLK
ncbi:guanine nucleotide-binding protein subunit alpha [Naganishia vaughanmartiniae]|uniref:Guanine nucleotide-binding protein subunit alpha n=1 Tax=Naganishia vaughanmartiniae TaxID=1424756 RepID=A0ACC2XD71_9TREE|nr:guanine nucleotide-binding protein subunit alpha [Naganishia vaughanmartiniae]